MSGRGEGARGRRLRLRDSRPCPALAETGPRQRRPGCYAGAVGQLGFGPTFQHMWDLYRAYSQAGFRTGYLDVRQLLLERGW